MDPKARDQRETCRDTSRDEFFLHTSARVSAYVVMPVIPTCLGSNRVEMVASLSRVRCFESSSWCFRAFFFFFFFFFTSRVSAMDVRYHYEE